VILPGNPEKRRELQFAPMVPPNQEPSDAQLDAMDQLIDALNLEVEDEEGQQVSLVNPEEELNPLYQFLFQALTERAIHPGREVPSVPPTLLAGMNMPPELAEQEGLQSVVQRIRELFPLQEEQDKRKGKRTGDKVFGDRNVEEVPTEKKARSADENPEVHNVGTVNPVEDFSYLLANMVSSGNTIQSLGIQMEEVIQKLLASAFGTDLNSKIVSCIKTYRDACVKHKQPDMYNEFIRELKDKVGDRLWSDIVDSEAGLIRSREVFGGVEDQQAERFLEGAGGVERTQEVKEGEEEEDMMDLL